MTCPDCEGHRMVDTSYGDPNDWLVHTSACETCDGSGTVEDDILCARCGRHIPVGQAVEGGEVSSMWRWWWFCRGCADAVRQ